MCGGTSRVTRLAHVVALSAVAVGVMSALGCAHEPTGALAGPTVTIQTVVATDPVAHPRQDPSRRPKRVYVLLEQDGALTPVRDGGQYTLQRRRFSLRFPLRAYSDAVQYAARIAIADHRTVFDGVRVGRTFDDFSHPFSMGKGLAAHQDGYHSIVLNHDAHHYLMHDPADPDAQRAKLLERLPDGRMECAFEIVNVLREQEDIPLQDVGLSKLYVAVLIDDDLDRTIDARELFRFELSLSPQ